MSRSSAQVRCRLSAASLRRRVRTAELDFRSTEEVPPMEAPLGQSQATEAMDFGLAARARGYNLYVSGPAGSGRLRTVLDRATVLARQRPLPADWLYVHNFRDPDRPRAIAVAAGQGHTVASEFDELVQDARRELRRAFDTDGYRKRRGEALADLEQLREQRATGLRSFALGQGFALEAGPNGFVALPVANGQPLTPEQVQQLPEPARADLERRGEVVREAVEAFLRTMRDTDREGAERVRRLDRDVCLQAIDPLIEEIRRRHSENAALVAHLADVREDIPKHAGDFMRSEEGEAPAPANPLAAGMLEHVDRYRVNAFVVHANGGAPIVHERNPSYYNLFGRIDYRGILGMQVTDFRQVKAGALHRANGGYLVLEAKDLLSSPFSWLALKRALQDQRLRIENLGEQLSVVPSATLAPEPIPLDVKVVLIGSPLVYQLLLELDEEFHELFRVKVEFAPDMEWDATAEMAMAGFVSRVVRECGLRHFDRSGVARLVEEAARRQAHQGRLSTRLGVLSEIVTEASLWAERADGGLVRGEDVERAVRERERRSSLLESRIDLALAEGTLRIAVEGERIGCVNGLSVIELGDHRFGRPVAVSAQVGLGRGGVSSIERDIELSGPIHSKGVLILAGYLAATFAQERPLPIAASITFEQSYEEVDGDSASSAELYALLSALSGLPLRQEVAVTGSVDQHGNVQAIGGVNEKVEGFFAVCSRRGLSGRQGVMIPAANARHLMLSEEVVRAVRGGRFHVWAVTSVDEGIEILTGRPADAVRTRVASRLEEYGERLRLAAPEPPAVNGHGGARRVPARSRR